MKKIFLFIFVLMLTLQGCTRVEPAQDTEAPIQELTEIESHVDVIDKMHLTESEEAYLDALKVRGVLRVASRQVETVFKEENGEKKGFNYNTIKNFTDAVGIDLEVHVVDNIEAFFRKDGKFNEAVRSDPYLSYKPDLFSEVDVYVDTLTQLPWREKLMDFIGFTPIRELVIHIPGLDIESVYDLDGKRVAVQAVSSYMSTLIALEEKYGLDMEYVYTDTILNAVEAVNQGEADLTIMDSNRAFLEMKKFDNIELGIPVTEVKYVGWAVSRDSDTLKSILEKYMDVLIEEGMINDLWMSDYDISFYEYYTLILKDASILEAMNLSAEEREVIDQIRSRGELRVAMQPNVVGYMTDGEDQIGFNYVLADELAKVIGVDLKVTVVDQFTKYFWKDGATPPEIKFDTSYFYVPDLFNEVDIYADNFTHMAWRKQILNQIEVVPVSTVIVQRVGAGIRKLDDLDGLTAAINKDTAYETVLNDITDRYDIHVEIVPTYSDMESYDVVSRGGADFAIVDSDIAFLVLQDFEDLEISIQSSESAFIGWAVKKEDDILASILTKYFTALKHSGMFDVYWEQAYGVSYAEYMRLITD